VICLKSHGCTIDHGGQASREFPILLKFEENWVVHDYLRTYLKNSAQKAKKAQQNKDRNLEAAAKGKARGACACALGPLVDVILMVYSNSQLIT
jgi:hypothetical protein